MSEALARLKDALAGRYRIERELGRGGMATVYLAHDEKHDRTVAIKVLEPALAAAIGPERFEREIRIAAGLQHPHVLALLDSGSAAGLLYYVMPHVEGESLRDLLTREKQLPLAEALRFGHEIADALSYAHARGVVHRDIKPENILLSGGHAVLTDFGIARPMPGGGGPAMTETGVTLGTPRYMSPEQAAGGALDGRSDLYSLACVVYEMLAGQPPFTGPTAESIVHQHLSLAPRAVSDLRTAVPAGVARALGTALAKAPADRFATTADFAAALAAGATDSAQPEASPPARPERRLALIGAALVVVAVVGAMLFLRPGRRASAPAKPAAQRTEVAVLPFENLSADPAFAYFAGGLQDELLTQLAKVAALRVISRTSAMGYRGTTKPLRQIGSELGVGSIVEGSVQVVDRRLRVNVQLIDVATDQPLWAERYDRTLDDAFAIQSEIAQRIVAAVGTALTHEEQARLATPPTTNAEAYRLYLQGMDYWNRPGLTRENWNVAVQLYGRAIALDPKFALAHAALSVVQGTMFWFRYDPPAERAARAASQRSEAETALRIAPDLPQAHIAMGLVHYFGRLDYDDTLKEMMIAQRGLPNDVELWKWITAIHRRMGHWDEALASYAKTVRLGPRDADTMFDLGGRTYRYLRRYGDAVLAFDKSLDLAPDLSVAAFERAWTYVDWQGRTDSLCAVLDRLPADTDLGPYGSVARQRAELLLLARDTSGLLAMPEIARGEMFDSRDRLVPGALYAAWAHQMRGETAAAHAAFAAALARLDATPAELPDDWRPHVTRGLALAGLGRRDEARREASWIQQSLVYRTDAVDGTDLMVARAEILAQVGDAAAAMDEIERVLSRPAMISAHTFELDPRWDPIRGEPRFKAILARYAMAEPH